GMRGPDAEADGLLDGGQIPAPQPAVIGQNRESRRALAAGAVARRAVLREDGATAVLGALDQLGVAVDLIQRGRGDPIGPDLLRFGRRRRFGMVFAMRGIA